ncbi:MAG: Hpt domain-containing protein, partial [Pseudomonadota bacterium]|nr:Hpt domain-containing protein [Pseudomonadota bacterium]
PAAEPPATAAEAAEAVDLDPQTLEQLAADTDPAMLARVIGLFVDESRKRLGAIREAAAAEDFQRLQREAHTLKSGAGTFGALRLQDHARRLDAACQNTAYDQALELAQSLPAVAERALKALARQYLH